METNRKTDWWRFLEINMWCLHLSLRPHINYIMVVWTVKMGDVINLFRVTPGSIWSWGFSTCGIAVQRPHLQRCRRCQRVPWWAASADRAPWALGPQAGQPHVHILRGSSFSLCCVCLSQCPKLRDLFCSTRRYEYHGQAVPCLWASPGSHGGCSSLPCPSRAASAPGPGKQLQTKAPSSLLLPWQLQITDFSFLAAAEKNTDIASFFCSAHISSKLKPNIFRYLNKRGKKKENLCTHRK